MSQVHRFVTNDFTVRIAAVDATQVVQEMQTIQNSMPLAAVGVGRAMVAALLLASHLKEGQQVGLLFKGNGPLGSVFAEANFEGHVRGYCPHPEYQAPNVQDTLNLGKALGSGNLTVARHQPFQRQPFSGTVQMVTGEVGDDIAHYLKQSQQIRSLVSLGVYLDTYGKVKAAGGVLIEIMPGVEEHIVEKIEKNAVQYPAQISKMIFDGARPKDLVEPYMKEMSYTEIPHQFEIKYFCPCTSERVFGALTVLGEEGLQEMINENQPTDVTCQICGRKYQVTTEELEKIKNEVRKSSMH
jgi:molecular chaperone Hsp33